MDTLVYALSTEGFEALSARRGRAGLSIIRERPVTRGLDMGLPDASGFDVLRRCAGSPASRRSSSPRAPRDRPSWAPRAGADDYG